MAVTLHQPHRVYKKASWTDQWAIQSEDGLYCDWFKFACSPDANEAQLSRNFGPQIMGANDLGFVNRNPLDIEGEYIKVEISQDPIVPFQSVRNWVGVVVKTTEQRWGKQGPTGEIGRQIFECRGLEFLLQRTIVDTAHVETEDDEEEIGRAIGFNMGSGHTTESVRIGNRSEDLGGNDAYIFAQTISDEPYRDEDAGLWSGQDIATYLLHYHPPRDRTLAQVVPFDLDDADGMEILAKFFPAQPAHEKSVKEILDELIDRRRIMTWWLETDPDDDRPSVRVATFNQTDLTLPSGAVIPANPNQTTWYTDDEGLIVDFQTVKDDSSMFHQVIARGEPLGVCFTIVNEEDCMEADWDPALETQYRNAASDAPGYGALEDWQKDSANQAMRNTDRFKKVYRYFRVPPDWDGVASGREVFRDPHAPTEVGLPVWMAGLRFGSMLPLLTESDYGNVTSVTSEMLEGSKPEYRRPFAVIYDFDADRYYTMDKMSYGQELDDGLRTNGRSWSANLRMQDDGFGVVVDAQGTYQHILAKDDFTAIDGQDFYDDAEALDWRAISCTVFCEFDGFAEAKYPETITSDDDAIRRIVFSVPNARLDYLAPETIIGVDNEGALQRCTSGGYVRDDREKLKDVARSAYEWYSAPRRSINATIRTLIAPVQLGHLITNVGSVNTQVVSNSVVTSLTFNLLQNEITVQTQFAQLDVSAFGGRPF